MMASSSSQDPLHEARNLGSQGLEDVEPGGQVGPGQVGGEAVVEPLDQGPVPGTGRTGQHRPIDVHY